MCFPTFPPHKFPSNLRAIHVSSITWVSRYNASSSDKTPRASVCFASVFAPPSACTSAINVHATRPAFIPSHLADESPSPFAPELLPGSRTSKHPLPPTARPTLPTFLHGRAASLGPSYYSAPFLLLLPPSCSSSSTLSAPSTLTPFRPHRPRPKRSRFPTHCPTSYNLTSKPLTRSKSPRSCLPAPRVPHALPVSHALHTFTHTNHARTSTSPHAPENLHALTSTCSHAINELTLSTSPRALCVLHALPASHARSFTPLRTRITLAHCDNPVVGKHLGGNTRLLAEILLLSTMCIPISVSLFSLRYL
jgi:hypothetical protein